MNKKSVHIIKQSVRNLGELICCAYGFAEIGWEKMEEVFASIGRSFQKNRHVTIDELKYFQRNLPAYVRYLLRIKAYKSQADMGRDLGVKDGTIRQIKRRANGKR